MADRVKVVNQSDSGNSNAVAHLNSAASSN